MRNQERTRMIPEVPVWLIRRFWPGLLVLMAVSCGGGEKRLVEIELLDWPDVITEVSESHGFRMGEPGHEVYLGRGWDVTEQDEHGRFFRWATGDTVEIRMPVVQPRPITCRLRWLSAPLGENERQGVVFLLDGHEVDRVSMRSRRLSWHELVLPTDLLRRGWNTLQMIPSTEARMKDDDRPLRFLVVEVELQEPQQVAVPAEDARQDLKRWVDSMERSGGHVVTAQSLVQFSVAVPKGSTLSSTFYSGGGEGAGGGATVTIFGQDADGNEAVVCRGHVKAGATPTEIHAEAEEDLTGLVIQAQPAVAGHGVALISLALRTELPAVRRQTVFLVTVDGLGYEALRPENAMTRRLPFLSRLRDIGFFFERAYAPAIATLPVYGSLMTGAYPFMHGVVDNEHGLSSLAGVLAQDLAAVGYRCVGIVANPLLKPERGRLERGFHRFVYSEHTSMSAGDLSSRAVQLILSEWPNMDPGFVWVQYDDVMSPATVPERFIRRVQQGDDSSGDAMSPADQLYYGALAYVDSTLETIRSLATVTGISLRSAWLIVGTRGTAGGEPQEPYQQEDLFEESIHVPVIVRVPELSEAPVAVRGTISLVDLRPTICQLAGAPAPSEVHGMSVVPLLQGREQRRTVFCEAGDLVVALRWPFKLIQTQGMAQAPTERVLFQLEDDADETVDRSDQYYSETIDLVGAWTRLVTETVPRYRPVPFGSH